jgi:hypothetical protein
MAICDTVAAMQEVTVESLEGWQGRESAPGELAEFGDRPEEHVRENAPRPTPKGVRCAGERSALEYDLVLEPSGLLAAATGYPSEPVAGAELARRAGSGLGGGTVEQAYLAGGRGRGWRLGRR